MRAWVVIGVAVLLGACGSKSPARETGGELDASGSGIDVDAGALDEDAGGDAATLLGTPIDGPIPQCSWPASMDPPDAAGAWNTGRFLLLCAIPGGEMGGAACVSSQPLCYDPWAPDAGGITCFDRCNLDEYAVGFNLQLGQREPPVPAACRFFVGDPAGDDFYCCPCE